MRSPPEQASFTVDPGRPAREQAQEIRARLIADARVPVVVYVPEGSQNFGVEVQAALVRLLCVRRHGDAWRRIRFEACR